MKVKSLLCTAVLSLGIHASVMAAQGEMGTGIPDFGQYGVFNNETIVIWSLADATISFPVGCNNITMTTTNMGTTGFRHAYSTLLTASTLQRRVRLYAHAPRDGGCGIDYIQLVAQ